VRLVSFPDTEPWIDAVLGQLEAAVKARADAGRSRPLHICLGGGTTPESVYRAMAAWKIRGVPIELWLGDERAVAPDDEAWNGRLVRSCFASCDWEPAPHLRLWPELGRGAGPDEARAACALYAAELVAATGSRPAFDLALLGLGADGHTASLFPGEPILGEERLFATTSTAPSAPRLRMSHTNPALAGARSVRFLVRGPGKLDIVRRLEGGEDLPASRIGVADTAILYCEK
jgi:6-phosphogluconolactonase